MNTKNTYLSKRTDKIISSVLPDSFKITDDKHSNGHKMLNAMLGAEFEALNDRIDYAQHMSNIELFDYGDDSELYSVELDHDLTTASGVWGGKIFIKLTDKDEFYDGHPTRLLLNNIINVSGIPYNIVGLEYLRTDRIGSGHLLATYDITAAEATISGLNPQEFYKVDDLATFDNLPYKSMNMGVNTQSYDSTGQDELLTPLGYDKLKKMYPDTKSVYLPNGNLLPENEDTTYKYYVLPAYDPSEYIWDGINLEYVPKYKPDYTYTEPTLIDSDGEVKYHRVYLNNPNGSGVYDTEYLTLQNVPISGTLKLYDIDNLTDSFEMTEIKKDGTQLYSHDGKYYIHDYQGYEVITHRSGPIDIADDEVAPGVSGWLGWDNVISIKRLPVYIGYSGVVPHEYVYPPYSGLVPAPEYKITSWDYVHEGDGLDGEWNWITNPGSGITNGIKIVNPISRYVVEYQHEIYKNVNYVSTQNSTRFIKQDDGNYLLSKTDTQDLEEIPHKRSRDERPAITFDPLVLRPGATLDRLDLSMTVTTEKLVELDNSNIYLHDKYLPGNSKLIPNIEDPREIVMDFISNSPVPFTEIIHTGVATDIQYKLNQGIKTQIVNGSYDSTTKISLEPEVDNFNRYFYMRCRINNSMRDTFVFQSGDADERFYILFKADGSIVVADNNIITESEEIDILAEGNDVEIIVETDWKHEIDVNRNKYNIFACIHGELFKMLHVDESDNEKELTFYNGTRLLQNAYLDVSEIKIYDRMEI